MIYSRETLSSIPPHVRLMLQKLDSEERQVFKRQSLLGKKVPLDEKSVGCTCKLEQLCDQHKGKQIEMDCIVFSDPTIPRKEPARFKIAKNDD